MRTIKEIAKDVSTLYDKGYMSDYKDTDYFYEADDDEIDKAYELLDELREYGYKAFAEKYLK